MKNRSLVSECNFSLLEYVTCNSLFKKCNLPLAGSVHWFSYVHICDKFGQNPLQRSFILKIHCWEKGLQATACVSFIYVQSEVMIKILIFNTKQKCVSERLIQQTNEKEKKCERVLIRDK